MKSIKEIGKNVTIYLGSAWVIMEAFNFFIERYGLEPLLLDITIIILVFGILATVVASIFSGRWNKKAVFLQIVIGVLALVSIGYFVTNPSKMNPRSLRVLPINPNKSPLRSLNSVAVLPIQNNLPDTSKDYLLAGLHDGIITELGKLGTLKTISRTTMLQYEDSRKSIRDIGTELDVNTVLESSLSPSNSNYILRVRLLDAKSQELVWTDEFETTVSEMPGLFETVSQIIATELNPNAIENIRVHEEVNPKAYAEVVQGNQLLQKFTADELWQALTHFERTIELDSSNLEGYLGVAKSWIYLQQLGVVDPKIARPQIYKYQERARQMDPDHWQTHYVDGIVKFFIQYDFSGGLQSALKSIDQNPNNSDARSVLAHCYMIVGDWDAAWAQMRYAKEIDPLNPQVIGFEFIMFGLQGKVLSAMKSMEILAAIDPNNLFYRMFSVVKNRELGNDEEAIKWLKLMNSDLTQYNPTSAYIDETFRETKSVNDTWYKLVSEFWKEHGYDGYYPSMAARTLYSQIPGYDDALFFENLRIMAEDRHPDMPYYKIRDGNSLQEDPRYVEIMEDLGFW